MEDELIRQSFDILKAQDKQIAEIAKQIPGATKSIIARTALRLGLERLTPEAIEALKRSYDIAIAASLNNGLDEGKRKPRAKRRA